MAEIIKIEAKKSPLPNRKKVAAYARVSMETQRLHHSLAAQISFYSDLIQKNPEWDYAGVYADEGISGTSVEKRPEFMRMMKDCKAGKIDLILTKSISRFARNTVDLLKVVRELKDLNIEVRFEKEKINSLSDDGELMLTLLASFAQEETISISNNVKWTIRKRMSEGNPNMRNIVYGYRWKDDTLIVVPEEAKIVRRIFQNFLDGKSRLETEREFAEEGITTRKGNRWTDSNIKVVLTNVTYTGNLLCQKEFVEDPITKKRKKNRGELPQYFIANTHEAIIDKETFDYVQEEMARRRALGPRANKSLNISCFTGKIKCELCGKSYMRNVRNNRAKHSNLGNKVISWVCGSSKKKYSTCSAKAIPDRILKTCCAKVLGLEDFDDAVFNEQIDKITVPKQGVLIFHFKDGHSVTETWENNAKKESWDDAARKRASDYRRTHAMKRSDVTCFSTKIRCEHCGCNFRAQTQNCSTSPSGKRRYWRCAEHNGCDTRGFRDDLLRLLTAEVLGLDAFDDAFFLSKIDHISVLSREDLIFHFYDGKEIARKLIQPTHEGHKWTEEQHAKFKASIKECYASERHKPIRKEKLWPNK